MSWICVKEKNQIESDLKVLSDFSRKVPRTLKDNIPESEKFFFSIGPLIMIIEVEFN